MLVAGVWGLLGLHLADDPVLPFDYLSYAKQLQVWGYSLLMFVDIVKCSQPFPPITVLLQGFGGLLIVRVNRWLQ